MAERSKEKIIHVPFFFLNILILLIWNWLGYLLEPILFGGYKIILLFLWGGIAVFLFFFFKSLLNKQNDFHRYILMGSVVLLFSSCYYSKMSALNNLDGQGSFYPMLSESFIHGQFHLLTMPPPELLGLSDPYEPVNIPGKIWDAALYDGKYYIYYGPVPAVVLAIVNRILNLNLDNTFLITFFLFLCIFMVYLIIGMIWKNRYSQAPWYIAFFCLVSLALSFPLLWLVGRPSVYESAISGGQAFLLTGIYLFLLTLYGSNRRPDILLLGAGCALGLSIGARWNLILPVLLLSFCGLFFILQQPFEYSLKRTSVIAFFAPLVLLAIVYGLYNYARFDNIFELGARYQLLGWVRTSDKLFSWANIRNNFLLYSFVPPKDISANYPFIIFAGIRDQVPYVYGRYGITPDPDLGYNIFGMFSSIVWLAPLSLSGIIFILDWIKGFFAQANRTVASFQSWIIDKDQLHVLLLTSTVLGCFIPLLFFTGTVMRYHMDYFLILGLLSSVGVLSFYSKNVGSKHIVFLNPLFFLLVLYSISVGFVASITSDKQLFLLAEPDFVEKLNQIASFLFGLIR